MSLPEVEIGNRTVGPPYVPLVVAEIGINHEGSLKTASEMVDAAKRAGSARAPDSAVAAKWYDPGPGASIAPAPRRKTQEDGGRAQPWRALKRGLVLLMM